DTVIAATLEILRQRHRHAADAAAEIEHAFLRREVAQLDEPAQELDADREKAAIADEDALLGRNGQKVVAQDLSRPPIELLALGILRRQALGKRAHRRPPARNTRSTIGAGSLSAKSTISRSIAFDQRSAWRRRL